MGPVYYGTIISIESLYYPTITNMNRPLVHAIYPIQSWSISLLGSSATLQKGSRYSSAGLVLTADRYRILRPGPPLSITMDINAYPSSAGMDMSGVVPPVDSPRIPRQTRQRGMGRTACSRCKTRKQKVCPGL